MPFPLSETTVQLLLQYITELDNPLPTHLISLPLLQRHHFLHIDPEDVVAYLTWPSTDSENELAVSLLRSVQRGIDTDGARYTIRYTGDDETMFSHVRIPVQGKQEALRLILQWDAEDSAWKYHNLALMPFPAGLHESVHDASRAKAAEAESKTFGGDGPDDDYWDSYGQTDEDGEPHKETQFRADAGSSSEDAYWSQYATVQGSGDSTIPSPVQPPKRPNHTANSDSVDPDASRHDEPADHMEHHVNSDSLDALDSNRQDETHVFTPPLLVQPVAAPAPLKQQDPEQKHTDVILSIPYSSLHPTISSPTEPPNPYHLADRLKSLGAKVIDRGAVLTSEEDAVDLLPSETSSEDLTREALRASLRGLYQLWHLSRGSQSATRAEFLQLVNETISEL